MPTWTSAGENNREARAQGPPPRPQATPCRDCGRLVEPHWLERSGWIAGRWLESDLCEACVQAIQQTQEAKAEAQRRKLLFRSANLPAGVWDWDFDIALSRAREIKTEPHDFDSWQRAYHACRTWHGSRGILYLYGDVGLGKTVLSWCLLRQALEQEGRPVYFMRATDLFMAAVDSRAAGSLSRDMEERAVNAGLLVIDELGRVRPRKRAREALFGIINRRVDDKLPTVVTSNHAPQGLASILREPFSPTVDRLVKSDGVLFEGRSFRLIEGEQRW